MKIRMLVLSCFALVLVLGLGVLFSGCANKPTSESNYNNYPRYGGHYLANHMKIERKLYPLCKKIEDGIAQNRNISKWEVFKKSNLGSDCIDIISTEESLGYAGFMHPRPTFNNTMPSAPAHDSIMYDLPKPKNPF